MARDTISLSIPARPRFGSLIRAAAANIGVRLDWSIIDIDRIREAVDQASSALIGQLPQKGSLDAVFEVEDDTLHILLALSSESDPIPSDRVAAFAEAVSSLVDTATIDADAGRIELTHSRSGT